MDMDKNNYKILILSDRKVLEKHHVSYDTILGMENEFVQSKYIDMVCLKKGLSHINKIVYKLFKFRMPDIMYGTKELQQANIIMYIAMGIFDLERNLETLRRLSLKGKKIVIIVLILGKANMIVGFQCLIKLILELSFLHINSLLVILLLNIMLVIGFPNQWIKYIFIMTKRKKKLLIYLCKWVERL